MTPSFFLRSRSLGSQWEEKEAGKRERQSLNLSLQKCQSLIILKMHLVLLRIGSLGCNGKKRRQKKNVANSEHVSSEMSDLDYMQDSYWSDIVLQSSPEREPVSWDQERKGGSEKKGQKKKTKPAGQPLLYAPIGHLLYTEDGQLIGSPNPDDKQEVKA